MVIYECVLLINIDYEHNNKINYLSIMMLNINQIVLYGNVLFSRKYLFYKYYFDRQLKISYELLCTKF